MKFQNYHFHLYYHEERFSIAREVVDSLPALESLKVGRLHAGPVGPHPIGSCQLSVSDSDYYVLMEWLLTNRRGLDVFVHPVSGDDWKDHTEYVGWIGKSYELNTSMFKR